MTPVYGNVLWRFEGSCVDDPDPDRWYALGELNGQPGVDTSIRELRDICAACPVKAECLAHALAYEGWGVWAGTTPKERKEIRRANNLTMRDVA